MIKKSTILRVTIFGFVIILLISCLLVAQENDSSFKTIKIYVQYNLAKDGLLDNNDINVNAENNKIILGGMIKSIEDKKEAEEDAESVSSDFQVINDLKIKPTNKLPEEIVKDVMNNIYGNTFYGVFDYVAAKYNNGVLTLSGYVNLPWLVNTFQKEAEKVPGIIEIKNEIKKNIWAR